MIVPLSSQAPPATSPSANLRPSLMMVFKSEPSRLTYACGEVSLMEKAPLQGSVFVWRSKLVSGVILNLAEFFT